MEEIIEQPEVALNVAPTAPITAELPDDGDGVDGDSYIPRLKILQDGKNAGSLYCEEMQESFETLDLILIRLTSQTRVLWPEKYSKNNDPLCRSYDGKKPSGDIDDESGGKAEAMCETCQVDPSSGRKRLHFCPYANWTYVDGKNIPPRCQENSVLLVMSPDLNIPFFYTVHGLARSIIKKDLLKPLRFRKLALSAKRRRASLSDARTYMFKFTLSSVLDARPAGNSMQPVVSDIKEIDDEMKVFVTKAAIQLQQFSSRDIKEITEIDESDTKSSHEENVPF